MKTIGKAIILSVLVMALASCKTFAPKPTETPTPTNTSLPTSTHTPEPTSTATETPTPIPPTETPAPSSSTIPLPSGQPVSSWEDIPIMPNAIAGEERNNNGTQGYSFTIEASADEIQVFYETELGKLGWNILAVGQGPQENTVMVIFMKGSDTMSFLLMPQPDGIMHVLLVIVK
jgi:hypothetical protein